MRTIRSARRAFHLIVQLGRACALLLALPLATTAPAANYTWDASGGAPLNDGGGAWNPTGGANWFDGVSTFGAWGNTTADTAIFGVGNGAAGAITVGAVNANGITFSAPGSSNYSLSSGTITLGGATPTITANVDATISSVIAGSDGLVKSGAGTLTLTNTGNSYSGATTINGGILSVADTGVIPAASGVTIANGATWRIGTNNAIYDNSVTVASGQSGVIQIASGTGNQRLNGDLSAIAGNLTLDHTLAGGLGAPGLGFILNGTAMGTTAVGSVVTFLDNHASNGHASTLSSASGLSVLGNSKVVMTKTGAGTLTLFVNTGGNAQFGALDGGGSNTSIRSSGSGVLDSVTVTINGTVDGSFAGKLENNGSAPLSLVKKGSSTQTLSGANTFTGSVAIKAGTLSLNSAGALGTSNAITLGETGGASNPTLQLNAFGMSLGALTVPTNVTGATISMPQNSGMFSHTINGATLSSALNVNQSNAGFPNWSQITWTAAITGAGGGAGNDTLVFNNTSGMQNYFTMNTGINNTFAGNVHVTSGVVAAQSGSPGSNFMIPDAAMLYVQSGEWRWNHSGFVETIDGLRGAGTIGNPGNVTLTINASNSANDGNRTFSGTLGTMAGTLTKTGSGTQEFSGTGITYTNATAINEGTLLVNGTHTGGGLYTVANGATLGGDGVISAPVTVQSGGKLAPGNSTGDLGTGNLLLSSGSIFEVNIDGLAAGTQYDQVDVTGTVDLTGSLLDIILGFSPSYGNTFTIIDNDLSDPVVGTFFGKPEGSLFYDDGQQWKITYFGGTGNDVVLMAVPEPSTYALALLGLAGLGLLAWRRRIGLLDLGSRQAR